MPLLQLLWSLLPQNNFQYIILMSGKATPVINKQAHTRTTTKNLYHWIVWFFYEEKDHYYPKNLKLVELKTLWTYSNLYALAIELTLKSEFMWLRNNKHKTLSLNTWLTWISIYVLKGIYVDRLKKKTKTK